MGFIKKWWLKGLAISVRTKFFVFCLFIVFIMILGTLTASNLMGLLAHVISPAYNRLSRNQEIVKVYKNLMNEAHE